MICPDTAIFTGLRRSLVAAPIVLGLAACAPLDVNQSPSEILDRAGYPGKTVMVNSLTWITSTEGAGNGGFFSTHPATADRIRDLNAMR